jgi:uncharacterized protein (DUF1810 family)
MADAPDLSRFVAAQEQVYPRALAELIAGRKTSHWMWFVFPQIAGLGHSPMAVRYAISGRAEAAAYLAHPLLGGRLREATGAVTGWAGRRSAGDIMGAVDAMKLRSSMTLFDAVAEDAAPFARCLDAFYAGARDERTLSLLG